MKSFAFLCLLVSGMLLHGSVSWNLLPAATKARSITCAMTPSPPPAPSRHATVPQQYTEWRQTMLSWSVAAVLTFLAVAAPSPVLADSRVVGEISGSGLVFKDTLHIESFDDPKVRGVTLYVSNFERPITERFGKNMFSDPSSASISCAKTGKVAISNSIDKSSAGEQVFEESRSMLFKTLRVQRIYDETKNTVVYVSFNTRLDKNDDSNKSRFTSGLCAVNLDEPGAQLQDPPPPAK